MSANLGSIAFSTGPVWMGLISTLLSLGLGIVLLSHLYWVLIQSCYTIQMSLQFLVGLFLAAL